MAHSKKYQLQRLVPLNEYVKRGDKDLASILTSSDSTPALAFCGPPGSGKTTAISRLTGSSVVRKHFTDGVYTIGSYANATANDLCEKLLSILEGLRLRRTLAHVHPLLIASETRLKGIGGAVANLASHPLLIAIDDIRANTEIGDCVRHILGTLVTIQKPRIRVIVALEERTVIDRLPPAAQIDMTSSVKETQSMMFNYAAISPNEVARTFQTEVEFNEVCDKCNGLPLFVMIVGRAIGELRQSEGLSVDDVWRRYMQELANSGRPDGRNRCLTDWQWSAVRLNGRMADQALGKFCKDGMFLSLIALPKNIPVPLMTLACLWDVSVSDAKQGVMTFARLGILEMKQLNTGLKNSGDTLWVVMHKVIHDTCSQEAEKRGEAFVKHIHERLVDSYYKLLAVGSESSSERQWWAPLMGAEEENEDDGYLTDNLIRHLSASGRIKETVSVLSNYRWTEVRMQRSRNGRSLQGFIEDVACFLPSLPNFTAVDYCATGETVEELREGLGFLQDAAKKAMSIVGQNTEELAFQLYGRLAHKRERSPVVKRYLLSVDRRAAALRREEKGLVDV